jgi:phosphotransferase system enzyme I (PtsP)
MIRAIDAAELQALMRELLDGGIVDVRGALMQWAADRSIELN